MTANDVRLRSSDPSAHTVVGRASRGLISAALIVVATTQALVIPFGIGAFAEASTTPVGELLNMDR